MQLKQLFKDFDKLQEIHGDNSLSSIYGAGEINNPEICFVFMNPTGKNISSKKSWDSIRAPWLGTKNIWKMFYKIGIIDNELYQEILYKKQNEWTKEFCIKVYSDIKTKSIYITNLSKATQIDARPLKNNVFKDYLDLFFKEIDLIKPKKIITFGGQVSSIVLGKSIKISEYRGKKETLKINSNNYDIYPFFYPVGQGMRNMDIVIENFKNLIK